MTQEIDSQIAGLVADVHPGGVEERARAREALLELTRHVPEAENDTGRGRDRRWWSAAWVVLIVAAVVSPLGQAVAGHVKDMLDPQEAALLQARQLLDQMEKSKPGPATNTQRDGGPEVDYAIDGPPSDLQDRLCRKDPIEGGAGDPLLCTLILAVANGEVEPGNYTTEEVTRLKQGSPRWRR